jgi:hypothetical protein
MRRAGETSWVIGVRRWEQLPEVALWIRAAERIDVPADPVVPGPLDIDPFPAPTGEADRRLGQQWREWWRALVGLPRWRPETPLDDHPAVGFGPPDFPGLTGWPELHDLVTRRWREAADWQNARKLAGIRAHRSGSGHTNEVVDQVERSLGRRVRPFDVEFLLLPVRDPTIRQVREDRFLVPERFYDGPQWAAWLGDLIRRIG